MKSIATIAATTLALANAAYAPDEILSLPGWTGALPTRQYSGYLNISDTTHLHYWLVESENNPATDPVVLWFNGGPGCSSLDGFFYEHGPFEIDTSDYSKLIERPYRWNSIANTLYIEAPVGVGFSYSDTNSYRLTDDKTAADNLAAVEKFYSMFPEFKANKFFITGESYAGVYVPTLAEAILKDDLAGTYTGAKLTGIAAGNGCSGTEVGICCSDCTSGTWYEWQYLLQTAFIKNDLKNQINAECDWAAAAQNVPNCLSPACVSLLNTASAQVQNVDLYNIYGDCVDDMCSASLEDTTRRGKVPGREYTIGEGEHARKLGRIIPHGPDACIDSGAASGYLNQPNVMAAIHVRDPGFCWAVCNTAPGWTYRSTRTNLPRDTYPFLIANMPTTLIFNGDWDACVPYTDAEAWTQGMNFPVKDEWHKWAYTSALGHTDQVAGYAVNYNTSSLGKGAGTFEFITIRGGRHEVPESAPAQAMEMLGRLLNGTIF